MDIRDLRGDEAVRYIEERLPWMDDEDNPGPGDFWLNPGLASTFDKKSATRSAVLIPMIIEEDGRISIFLIKRPHNMRVAPGEYTFPGGKADPDDRNNREETVLRECEEEIGVPRDQINLIGRLPDYCTRTGFIISPFVGIIKEPLNLKLSKDEVEGAIKISLPYLLDHDYTRETQYRDDTQVDGYSLLYGEYEIWGPAAYLLRDIRNMILAEPKNIPERKSIPRSGEGLPYLGIQG